jgi:glyoxylase-like metal-dependent hydrolase (beta-lactamase superfamily II)
MPEQVVTDHNVEALKRAGSWPGADRATLVTLATLLAATGADHDGLAYFEALAAGQPDQVLPLALAGYFQVRTGRDVPAGVARLDQAASRDLGLAQYYRGLALATLPPEAGYAKQAVSDLEFVLAVRDQLPSMLIRAVYHGLAAAYAATGQTDLSAKAAADSGLVPAPPEVRLQFGGGWANGKDGFRFSSPRIIEVAPGARVAQGYDFADFGLVSTEAGVVAIDAGTAEDRARAAMADAGVDARDVSRVFLTHAHFDHVGGLRALAGPGTQLVAQAGFPAELQRQRGNVFPFRYFTGSEAGKGAAAMPPSITIDHLISDETTMAIGGTDFVLYPTTGGETSDALMVYLPATGVLFVGDVMMPYLGAPFFAEGSPEGLLGTLRFIAGLGPRLLVHGHTTLTETFTSGTVPGLLAGLTELHDRSLAGIGHGLTLTGLLKANIVPEVLRDHPAAVAPYIAMRDHFVQRLYQQRSGYWQPDGQGLEPVDQTDRAAALDLLAGGRPERFVSAARTLLEGRDPALALELINAGLARHPGSGELGRLRQESLYRLMERHQLQDPFRFLIYAELAGVEIGPVAAPRHRPAPG